MKSVLEYVDRAIKLINNHYFKNEDGNIMEKYLEVLFEKWMNEGLVFDNFPFKLFSCKDEREFYVKYFDVCVPHLICNDSKVLHNIAKQLQISEKEIVEVS